MRTEIIFIVHFTFTALMGMISCFLFIKASKKIEREDEPQEKMNLIERRAFYKEMGNFFIIKLPVVLFVLYTTIKFL